MKKKIILFCPGNLNFGDNAILHAWLELFDRLLCKNDEAIILGCETGYIETFLTKFQYKIYCTDLLHQYIWKNGATEVSLNDCIANVIEDNLFSDRFNPMPNLLQDLFQTATYVHILGGGILNSMWEDVQYQVKLVVSLCRKYNKKAVFTGQTIGPLDEKGEENLREVFQYATMCDLRDMSCFSYVKSCNDSTMVSVDDVFVHLLLEKEKRAGKRHKVLPYIASLSGLEHINVCIQKWNSLDEKVYQAQLQKLGEYLNGYLSEHPNCMLYMLELMPLDHDLEMADQLASFLNDALHSRIVKLSFPNFYPFDVAEILRTAVFNMGTRFHMALFSMAAHVPTVSFSLDDYYVRKFRGLEELFECEFTVPFDSFNVSEIERILSLTKEAQGYDNWLPDVQRKIRCYCDTCFDNGVSTRLFRILRLRGLLKLNRKTDREGR